MSPTKESLQARAAILKQQLIAYMESNQKHPGIEVSMDSLIELINELDDVAY